MSRSPHELLDHVRPYGWKIAGGVWPVATAVLVAWGSWHWWGGPTEERNERQAIAIAQRAEARVSIAAFVAERPRDTAVRQRAVDLYRDGRRLADAGRYEQASDRFAEAFAILEEACRDCPAVSFKP